MPTHPTDTTTRPALGPGDAGRAVSAEEFAAADFAEPWRYERSEGRLVVMSPDSEEHDDVSEPLRDRLGAYRLTRPDVVEKVVSEAWVRIPGANDRIADIAVYLAGDRSRISRPDRVPEIILEILSPGRDARERDSESKRDEYLRVGVIEYLVVDRFARRVTVFTPAAGGHAERALGPGDRYESPRLPGLVIPLADVF